jgi:anaerobic magnesium-protoporphyrin IX monomethyl ester cyclase
LLATEDWDDFDLGAVMESPMSQDDVKEVVQTLYKVFFSPEYILRKLVLVRSLDDLRFVKKGIARSLGA